MIPLLVLVATSYAGPEESVIPKSVRQAAILNANEPLPDRMKAISDTLLGRPYTADPLGEGAGIDPDPFVRYDTFDCLTFVEEVVALSLAADPEEAATIRTSLRYGGAPKYTTRNHFMEHQWIPAALENHWLKDTTATYGPTHTMVRRVTEETWKRWRSRGKFAHTDEELPLGTMKLEVLGLDDAIAAASRIKPGTIVLTVRANLPSSPIWISHLGFTIPADVPTVRHATKMGSGGTKDHRLVWYLNHLKTYKNWPAVGISLLEPVEFGPRLSRLPPSKKQ